MALYIKPDEDCMGVPAPGYWRQFMRCSDGTNVIGIGKTEDEADLAAENKKAKREFYLTLPDLMRLKILIEGDLLDSDKKEAIQIIGQWILKQ